MLLGVYILVLNFLTCSIVVSEINDTSNLQKCKCDLKISPLVFSDSSDNLQNTNMALKSTKSNNMLLMFYERFC